MPSFWDDFKKTIKQGVTVAAEKTEEYTKIGKIKVEILNVKKNLDKTLKELGENTYTLLKKDKSSPLAQNDKLKKLMAKVEELQKSIKVKEAEIEVIKKATKKTAPKPATTQKPKTAPKKGSTPSKEKKV